MTTRMVTMNDKEYPVYKDVDDFIANSDPTYKAYIAIGETYEIRPNTYLGCSECPHCQELSIVAKHFNVSIIRMKMMHDIVGLAENPK